MTPTVVTAADAAQFLAVVPRMLGYHPARSLVVIPFHGGRSLGAMRFDLPPDGDPGGDSVAATVIGMACRLPEADSVAAIAYTDARFGASGGMRHRALLDALAQRADACGLRVTDLLCVAGDGWGSSLDAGLPHSGRPLAELSRRAQELDDLPEPEGDQATGAALPSCTPAERARVAGAIDALSRAIVALCGPDAAGAGAATDAGRAVVDAQASDLGPVPRELPVPPEEEASGTPATEPLDPRALATVARFDDLPALYEEALADPAGPRDAYDSAALIWCLSRPALRDVALVQWSSNVTQGDAALEAQLRWEGGAEYPEHLAMRMGGEGDPPDAARLATALALTRQVAAAAPRDLQPGPLAMCAWLAWALGRSTHAAAYAEMAGAIDPAHGLTQIVRSFVQAGHVPDWAFHRGAR